jgi:hypothetical protein
MMWVSGYDVVQRLDALLRPIVDLPTHSANATIICCSRPRAASSEVTSFGRVAEARMAALCKLAKDLSAARVGRHRTSPGGTENATS